MRYIQIEETKVGTFVHEFETKEEAIRSAEDTFEKMTKFEKERTISLYVLESVNPDKEAEDHFDGNIIREWDLC